MNQSTLAELYEALPADELMARIFADQRGPACMTCSFQVEDMVVLHLLRQRQPDIPVLFLDTGYHFPETYSYRDRMVREWKINLINVTPPRSVPEQEAQFGILHRTDPGRCCQLRKVEPLMHALEPYEIWFTGLRREQSPTRKNLRKVEQHHLPGGRALLKVSVLADWIWQQVWSYTTGKGLSYLPQYDRGYLSIGCEPCTAIPDDPNNPRSGRWGGTKLECGIHTFSERGQ
jgi:phosphoadenosine phosphosulfate reductase